jgi:sugar-specific transcriptional regulator TrmB
MYTIHELNEKRGSKKAETFKTLKEAIDRLNVHKFVARKHGKIIKERVKSFIWQWQDEYCTTYQTEYRIERD